MSKPLYPIKADPTTLDGVTLTLGVRGSVEGSELNLTGTTLTYEDEVNSNTLTVVSDSLKVSNSTDTIHLECKKEGVMILDTTGYSNLTVDKLVLTSGETDTLTLDDSQLLSNTLLFKVKSEFAAGTISLEAPNIQLSGAITIPVDAINAPASIPTGEIVPQCIRVKVGGTFYRIALHKDA